MVIRTNDNTRKYRMPWRRGRKVVNKRDHTRPKTGVRRKSNGKNSKGK